MTIGPVESRPGCPRRIFFPVAPTAAERATDVSEEAIGAPLEDHRGDADPRVVLSVEGLVKHYGGSRLSTAFRSTSARVRFTRSLERTERGKSTLMKILAGAERPDQGTVRVDGVERSFASGADATRAGIAIVFQELSLYPDVDVLANLFAMREPRRWGISSDAARWSVGRARCSTRSGCRLISTRAWRRSHSTSASCSEIAKALLLDTRILILDEPTSALTAAESTRLFDVVRRLRAAGKVRCCSSHIG